MSAVSPSVSGPPLAPQLCVCDDDAALSAVRLEFAAAGWLARLVDPPRVAGECPARMQEVCVVERMPRDAIGHALDALVHGATVLATTADEVTAAELYDQGRRIVAAEWFDAHHRPTCIGLDRDQITLLLALREGCTIDAAARTANLSSRTAARRLTAARATLGARSTAEAVTIVGRRIDQLRLPG